MTTPAPSRTLNWIDYPAARAEGGDVVLLHGLGSSAGDWVLQAPILQDRHHVIAIDLPGFGESPPLRGWPTISAYARAVAEAMEEAEMASAHVIGLSLGGCVALQLGIDLPQRAASLTLVNAFARFPLRPRAALRNSTRVALALMGRMGELGAWVARDLFPEDQQAELRKVVAERLARNDRRSYLQAGVALARFNARRRLAEVRSPTLVVAGEGDTTVPLAAKEELARGIRGARLLRLPRSGHASPIDEAQRFNRGLEAFLEEVEAAGRPRPETQRVRRAEV